AATRSPSPGRATAAGGAEPGRRTRCDGAVGAPPPASRAAPGCSTQTTAARRERGEGWAPAWKDRPRPTRTWMHSVPVSTREATDEREGRERKAQPCRGKVRVARRDGERSVPGARSGRAAGKAAIVLSFWPPAQPRRPQLAGSLLQRCGLAPTGLPERPSAS